MEIYLNDRPVVMKTGSSFEYTVENRCFTDADAYTLNITLPLAGCSVNMEVFGRLFRADCPVTDKVFECRIVDGLFERTGVAVITGVSTSEVTVQFLEGRSAQNYRMSLDDTYINELDLGEPHSIRTESYSVEEAWGFRESAVNYMKYVAYPWWNTSAEAMNNEVTYIESAGRFQWTDATNEAGLSFFPYMLWITRKICEAIGYSHDFSAWEASGWRYLVCCNALPAAWENPAFAAALPHWSVTEFFGELEKLMACEIDIDYTARHVTFRWAAESADAAGTVALDTVVDDHTEDVENVATADSGDDDVSRYYRYADDDSDSAVWKRYTCGKLISHLEREGLVVDKSPEEFNEWLATMSGKTGIAYYRDAYGEVHDFLGLNPHPYIVRAYNRYWMSEYRDLVREYDFAGGRIKAYNYNVSQIGTFASGLSSEQESSARTVNIVPVCLGLTEYGYCAFLSVGSYSRVADSKVSDESAWPVTYKLVFGNFSELMETLPEDGDSVEYISRIRVGFVSPAFELLRTDRLSHPMVDSVYLGDYFNFTQIHAEDLVDLALNQNRPYNGTISMNQVDASILYKFSFLSRRIPPVRSVFIIKGRRFLCKKMTATFTENGMSQLIKGEFYMVGD